LINVSVLIDGSYFYTSFTYVDVYSNLGFTAVDLNNGSYPFLMNRAVYRYDARVSYSGLGDDWYETAVAQPDAVVADLMHSLQPSINTFISSLNPPYLWFRNVALNQSIVSLPAANSCSDPSAPSLPLVEFANQSISSLPNYTCPSYLLTPSSYIAPLSSSSSSTGGGNSNGGGSSTGVSNAAVVVSESSYISRLIPIAVCFLSFYFF